ncbi:family 16 glycosylhydrolase [Streptomyces sp. S.PB5]|uniref:glycoside hydrolase family 16 protein n=1 Tax=Streptomyces sp. S.PB5 TaxID=3020844 RepID=UPI0025B097AB|nr:family 16 glycosylhydrolase [Streptomyces sp. S.PB5]MDN3022785.1 family 16 glycosylhydrolase [Streptomyces sp. S.PB5]
MTTDTTTTTGAASDRTLVWSDEFDAPISWGTRWTGDRSSAYRYADHNPDDSKLDRLTTDAVSIHDGVVTFTATPSEHILENGERAWDTGLLTTEYSSEGFQVQTGDFVEVRVRMPAAEGAWPALWTWKDGGNEIDSFEYHPDNADVLELSNHLHHVCSYYSDDAIGTGRWVTIGTWYQAYTVKWYVNGGEVFSDGKGVGDDWSAYLILNLSVSSGTYHPAPSGPGPVSFDADYIRVYR